MGPNMARPEQPLRGSTLEAKGRRQVSRTTDPAVLSLVKVAAHQNVRVCHYAP